VTIKQLFLIILLIGIAYAIYILLQPKQPSTPEPSSTPETKPTIILGTKEITVDLANTPQKRSRGLGGTHTLPPNHGMLFIFDQKDISPPFWMKDMLIPIDIIWINDNKVTQINERVEPPAPLTQDENLPLILPEQPIDYVLEVRAGFASQFQITVGDPVILPEGI
jgi:hypothetical protein